MIYQKNLFKMVIFSSELLVYQRVSANHNRWLPRPQRDSFRASSTLPGLTATVFCLGSDLFKSVLSLSSGDYGDHYFVWTTYMSLYDQKCGSILLKYHNIWLLRWWGHSLKRGSVNLSKTHQLLAYHTLMSHAIHTENNGPGFRKTCRCIHTIDCLIFIWDTFFLTEVVLSMMATIENCRSGSSCLENDPTANCWTYLKKNQLD